MFGCLEVEYLGHLISSRGVKTDPKKIEAMVNWPIPTSVKALRVSEVRESESSGLEWQIEGSVRVLWETYVRTTVYGGVKALK